MKVASVYADALYGAVNEKNCSSEVLEQLKVLNESFKAEPEYLKLLSSHSLSKQERLKLVDDGFRDKIDICLLNFIKILVEKGYIKYFPECCVAYKELYNEDHNIMPVCAVTAVPLTEEQKTGLKEKLNRITGKTVDLVNKIDSSVLGGIRLDYDGKRLDDTVAHRLEAVRSLLKNTVL